MPYRLDEKLIFLHIPKTGGTSIEDFFGMKNNENLCFYKWDVDQINYLEGFGALSDSPNIIYAQHYTLDIIKDLVKEYKDYFKFTFVRNPYTRILSEFFWVKSQHLEDNTDFNSLEFHNWCVDYLAKIDLSHKEPQTKYVDETVNFIGKYENLHEDFELLKSELINFSSGFLKYKNKKLLHLNATGHRA